VSRLVIIGASAIVACWAIGAGIHLAAKWNRPVELEAQP
jgi:predicted transporter